MYIIGRHYRGNPDQKPEQWGSIADVQYAVRANCEDWLGVDYNFISCFFPMWEGAGGKIIDISPYANNGLILNMSNYWADSGVQFSGDSDDVITVNHAPQFSFGNGDVSFYVKIKDYNLRLESNGILSQYGVGLAAIPTIQLYSYNGKYSFRVRSDNNKAVILQSTSSPLDCALVGVKKENNCSFYINSVLEASNSATFDSITNTNGIQIGRYWTTNACQGIVQTAGIFKKALNKQQIQLLNSQPYKLFEPVSRPLYLDFTGGGAISASCIDGSLFSTQIGKSAKFSVVTQDSISLGDSDVNNAKFLTSITDITSFSDNLLSYIKILAQSLDGVTYSDQILSNTKLLSVLVDNIVFKDNILNRAKFLANNEDGIKVSDTVSSIIKSVISVECLDGITYLDNNLNNAKLQAKSYENVKLQDTLSNILKAVAQTSDTTSFYDISTFGSILSALAEDGISLSDTSAEIIRLFVNASDSIKLNDNGQVNVKYTVNCSDTIQYADTVTNVMRLLATLFDGVDISDRALEVSTLPSGKTRISFSIKTTTITFDIATPSMSFNTKTPNITFNVK